MTAPTLVELIVQETKAAIYARALSVAATVGLVTTTWEDGDPEPTLFDHLATTLYNLEQVAARYVASGFLDLAAQLDDLTWLRTTAYEQYGYSAREATYATCTVRLTNAGGGLYTIAAQDLVFAQTADADVTYRNTSGGTLAVGPGTTLDVSVSCDIAGSRGSAAIAAIGLVTSLPGVTASNTTAAVGVDEESAASIVSGCRNKLEALSPNGAAGAYAYVALNSTLTGASDVTRARVVADSNTGDVTIYIASSAGAASSADRTLVETAIARWATPLGITATTTLATAVPTIVTATVRIYDTVGVDETTAQTAISAAVTSMLGSTNVGGDGDAGKLYVAKIYDAIVQTYPGYVFGVEMSAPSADIDLDPDEVVTLSGSSAFTISLESAP